MPVTPQISYRDVEHSDSLDRLIVKETAKLDRYFSRIINCRVLIEHRRHRAGAPFQARVELKLPGHEIFVNREPDEPQIEADAPFKDPVLAVRDAFKKARRRLQDYVKSRMESTG